MADRSKTVIGRWFPSTPATTPPSWSKFGQTTEAGFTANPQLTSSYTLTTNHVWNDTSHSSRGNSLLENHFIIKHKLNSSLTALSASPDHNHVVVAGREGSNK